MRKNVKKAITAAVALMMTAALAATIYAADYGDPEASTTPAPSASVEADTSAESINDAIDSIIPAAEADSDADAADAGELLDRTETERELVAQSGAQYIPAYQIIIIFEIPAVILAVLISTRRTRKKR